MAYLEITPLNCSDMATAVSGGLSTDIAVATRTGNGYGAYVKCTGIDATKLVFMLSRNSSECSTIAYIDVVAGSTLGAIDYQQGKYSTLQNFRITVPGTTDFTDKGSTGDGNFNSFFFSIPNTSKFLDSNQYLKMRFSAQLSASANACHGSFVIALHIPS